VEGVIQAFKKLGLNVEVSERMPAFMRIRGDRDVFTLSVDRKKKGTRLSEKFVMHPGKDNEIRVLDTDTDHKQMVLMVHEKEGAFQQRTWDSAKKKFVWTTQRTSGNKLKYLIGMDERSYFMAPLSGSPTTVKQAHQLLRPRGVLDQDAQKKKVIRQGEWFFVPYKGRVSESSLIYKKTALKARPNATVMGKPHIAEMVIWMDARRRGINAEGDHVGITVPLMLVKGAVRHDDHETVTLRDWHEVHHNMESRTGNGRWID
jgi:hypothetical protein